MTMSEFDTLRADLAGLRSDVDRLRVDIDTHLAALRSDIEIRFIRLETKIDEKPSAATIY